MLQTKALKRYRLLRATDPVGCTIYNNLDGEFRGELVGRWGEWAWVVWTGSQTPASRNRVHVWVEDDYPKGGE